MKIASVVVIMFILIMPQSILAKARYENMMRYKNSEKIKNTKLDLWDGKPKQPYTVIGAVKGTHPGSTAGTPVFMVDALYYLKLAAISLNADAVIQIECCNPKYVPSPLDKGDFYEKNKILSLSFNQSGRIECAGVAVKYK